MAMKPLYDQVLIKKRPHDMKKGGILLPTEAAARKVAEPVIPAIVIAAGPGKRLENGDMMPMSLKPNDQILVGKFSGKTFKYNGEEFTFIKEEEIHALVDDSEDAVPIMIPEGWEDAPDDEAHQESSAIITPDAVRN